MREAPQQHWTPGKPGAEVGTREWADFIRLHLVAKVEHLGTDDENFVSDLEFLTEHRAWSLLTKRDGSTFGTRDEFCAYERPWGLGTPWEKLRPYVRAAYARRGMSEGQIERALDLNGVSKAMGDDEKAALARAAKAAKAAAPVPDSDAPLLSYRNANSEGASKSEQVKLSRLRAINRAPEAVREAYQEERISQTLAAKLGPRPPGKNASAERVQGYLDTKARAEAIAQEVRCMKDRKQIDALVRERLGVEAPVTVRVERQPDRAASRLVERFGREWCRDLVIALDAAVQRDA